MRRYQNHLNLNAFISCIADQPLPIIAGFLHYSVTANFNALSALTLIFIKCFFSAQFQYLISW